MHRLAHAKAAGQVAQHIDAPEARHRRRQRGRDLRPVEQVGGQEQPVVARVAKGGLQGFKLPADQHQPRALAGKGGGHRLPEVAGGAGHHHRLVLEAHGVTPWRLLAW